jgi:hypothetical protein
MYLTHKTEDSQQLFFKVCKIYLKYCYVPENVTNECGKFEYLQISNKTTHKYCNYKCVWHIQHYWQKSISMQAFSFFIYGLFRDIVNSSDYTVSDNSMIIDYWTGKDVEGSRCSII